MKFLIVPILTILILIFIHPRAYCHLEPPKTIYEKSEQEKERLRYKNSGIQMVIMWSSVNKNKKYMMSKSLYDTNGNIIEIKSYSESGTEQKSIRYLWDKSNVMTEQITTDIKKGKERTVFLYDSTGLIKRIYDYDSSGSLTDWFDYEYDIEKNTITLIKLSHDSTKIYTIRYKYKEGSPFQYLIEAEQWDNNGIRAIKINYKIENGRKTERQLFLSDGTLDHTLKYDYRNDGQFKEISKIKSDGSTLSRRIFKYNKANHVVEEIEYDSMGVIINHREYEYKYFKKIKFKL